ncbi:Neuroglian [Toxocara canis]|uniref:Neuroglian n=1 Tax=Toxocara canis TaxID=6265 RepID=A0A0B2UXF7_TOXCA|nr:Neuroglian [Toxocara canis]
MRLLFITVSLTAAIGPPKLELQSAAEVWFQWSVTNNVNNKFSLRCQASENPETFEWYKDGRKLHVDGERILWQKPSQTGNIIFIDPRPEDQGYYQCFISNIFGTAVSNKVHVKRGVLEHFKERPVRRVVVEEGHSLSVRCDVPYGIPSPSVFWLYRDTLQTSIIETIRRAHIAVDPQGSTLHFTEVGQHDGRENLVYQCAATSPVLHGEYRAGDEVQLIVTPSSADVAIPIHKLWFSPEQVNVKAGSKLKLMCIFGGRPLPSVSWSKIDGELPKKRMKDLTSPESDFGKALIVENVHPNDAGIYECRSHHLFHQMHVDVTAAPFWEFEAPLDVDQPEESTAELHCIASGNPTPIIQWYMNGQPLHEVPENNRRLILDGGRILRITKLDHDVDTAVYQCNASNPFGYIFANAFVNVRAHAPRFTMPDRRVWKVVRKTTVEMSCDVDAAPEAVVRWVDENDQSVAIIPGKIHLFPNHTLQISQVNSADEGLYYCNVSNKYGLNRAYNKLEVFNPTHFIRVPSPKKPVVEAHESFNLYCEAVCDPRLTADYSWTHNGVPINDSEHFRITNNTLRLMDVRGWHSGGIDCIVVTDVDVKVSGIQLTVLDVPAKPVLSEVDCNERRAMIRWQRSSDHGDRITSFLVQMHTDFEKGKWQTVVEEENTSTDFYQADITLSPWVNYTFRVIANNWHGESEPGYKEGAICRTKESFPYGNPSNVTAEGDEPNNLVIRWKPMDKYEWNAPDLHYNVRYKLNEPGAQWKETHIEDPLANHTVIRDQPTFREYLVQVEAVNRVGKSIIEPLSVIGFSGEDVPLESPNGFGVVEFINCTSVAVGWQHIDRHTVRGHFRGYQIEYWEDNKPFVMEKMLVANDRNEAILSNLNPITNYTARIHTVNGHYRSESQSVISFSTPEGIPSKVHNLRVRAVGATSLLITWHPPRHPNGNIRGYFLTFENSTSGHVEETYVLNRQLHYLHEEAEPDTGYKVSVWAETNGGEGPKVMRAVRTWPLRNPDVPMFKVTPTSPQTAQVQWIPSNDSEWAMPGPSFYVNYSLSESDIWQESEVINLPRTHILLDGLQEDTNYRIVGVSKEGNRHSASNETTIRTLSRATMTHISRGKFSYRIS